jgi:DNA-binding IclR family transcriptional regulator
MSAPPERIHNVIAVLEQFTDQGTKTVPMVAEETGLPEPVVRDCLGRLEDADLLVRARGSTDAPVWLPATQTEE